MEKTLESKTPTALLADVHDATKRAQQHRVNYEAIIVDPTRQIENQLKTETTNDEDNSLSKLSDAFSKLNIATKIQIDTGKQFTIDVQPDMRYPTQYIIYNIVYKYTDLPLKTNSFVSNHTLAAYCTVLYVGHLLNHDLSSRDAPSYYAAQFTRSLKLHQFLVEINKLPVPPFMVSLLDTLNTLLDPQKPNLQYVPCLASAFFPHDCGRLVPCTVWLRCNHAIATEKSNEDPTVILKKVLKYILITYETRNFMISNLFGHLYEMDQQVQYHINWFNVEFMKFFNPTLNRAHVQRPFLSPTPTQTYVPDATTGFNPYIYLLACDPINIVQTSTVLQSLSRYISTLHPNAPMLIDLQSSASDSSVLTHTIEPVTLPTWHLYATVPDLATPTVNVSDTTYATHVQFMVAPPAPTETIPMPTEYEETLYRAKRPENDPPPPWRRLTFKPEKRIRPHVFVTQPYLRDLNHIKISISNGIKIEHDYLDGCCVPQYSFKNPLAANNSRFETGMLPIAFAQPLYHRDQANFGNVIIDRDDTDDLENPTALCLTDMSRNILPHFDDEDVSENCTEISILREEDNHTLSDYSFTYFAFNKGNNPNIPDEYIPLWSSYRHNTSKDKPTNRVIFMYPTLQQFYGKGCTLMKLPHPSEVIPK